jgi:hypothetical protein
MSDSLPLVTRACPIWGYFRPKTNNRVTGPVTCLRIGAINPSRRDDSSLPAQSFRTFRHTYPYFLFFRLRFCLESSRSARFGQRLGLGLGSRQPRDHPQIVGQHVPGHLPLLIGVPLAQ